LGGCEAGQTIATLNGPRHGTCQESEADWCSDAASPEEAERKGEEGQSPSSSGAAPAWQSERSKEVMAKDAPFCCEGQ